MENISTKLSQDKQNGSLDVEAMHDFIQVKFQVLKMILRIWILIRRF
jgi:hypothetical protein